MSGNISSRPNNMATDPAMSTTGEEPALRNPTPIPVLPRHDAASNTASPTEAPNSVNRKPQMTSSPTYTPTNVCIEAISSFEQGMSFPKRLILVLYTRRRCPKRSRSDQMSPREYTTRRYTLMPPEVEPASPPTIMRNTSR